MEQIHYNRIVRATSCLLTMTILATTACSRAPMADSPTLVSDLHALEGKRIYFGHQSVGANILQGVRETLPAGAVAPLITDTFVGVNGDPAGKCTDFARKFEEAAAQQPIDIALMKFCYIDFDRDTDPAALFGRYSSTIDSLRAKHPSIVFIPITAPLTTRSPAWKRAVKSVLGRDDAASQVNALRVEFNRLLLAHYSGQPVFDLAKVESTMPDGSRVRFEVDSKEAFALADVYSDDGGHLNADGRKLAAAAFLHTLAGAVRPNTARVSPF
jgi:hypothetical protein